jgi:hypothetical protein
VPKGCAGDGDSNEPPAPINVGSCGLIAGAMSAASTSTIVMPSPIMAPRLRRSADQTRTHSLRAARSSMAGIVPANPVAATL